ncbi:hypothetical protein EOA75_16915 [Mesorhizobium sp. M1A.F.Ca.IN.022.07.1.1]|nr:hypothetical protein EOA75_16915 [Mesorhizobium sp. M1A.F.Ca.IN.022.07.1.1]RWG00746.1 MAG: hypothetical protein EOQ54_25655 [Mesorhizobium sp.]RWG96639.1 MAG: hypothetical protein EOQ72_21105 [Mesorhizobium sp.]TIS04189.1 MAG: hypothetical protein E5X13_02615 [Mesorhizobium sp.]TJV01886.1 MAG: hypothetical protein E5Y35_29675 [Mesorhizobium sp.]
MRAWHSSLIDRHLRRTMRTTPAALGRPARYSGISVVPPMELRHLHTTVSIQWVETAICAKVHVAQAAQRFWQNDMHQNTDLKRVA